MTLIILLCTLALEHLTEGLDNIRRFGWFDRYHSWLANKLARWRLGRGKAGLIMVLAGPLLLLLAIDQVLQMLFLPLSYLFAGLILLSAIGPKSLPKSLVGLIRALDEEDDVQIRHFTREMCQVTAAPDLQQNQRQIIEGIFTRAHEGFFAVIFWFTILGPFGAMLYRFARIMRQQAQQSTYADAAQDLCHILDWPAVRLMALGNALAGNMTLALAAWRANEKKSFLANENVLTAVALGALQYNSAMAREDNKSFWYKAAQGLLNRTLVIWLAVLGLMTIAGIAN